MKRPVAVSNRARRTDRQGTKDAKFLTVMDLACLASWWLNFQHLNCSMSRFWIFLLLSALAACRFNHHEQMTPHWTSSPDAPIDCYSNAAQIVINGHFRNENIYVQNPLVYCDDTTARFCVYAVTINDSLSVARDSLASSIFKIPLTKYGFRQGDSLRIVIAHYNGGMPVVMNPEVR